MNASSNGSALPPPPHVIDGERLRLRDLRIEDAQDYYADWMNDPEVVRFTESRLVRHTRENLRDFIEGLAASPRDLFLAITKKKDGRHIGNIKLGNINFYHGTAELGIIIGDKSCWGLGFAGEAINLIADYAFNTIGLHKLIAGNYTPNTGSTRAFEKAGFKIEGILRDHSIYQGNRIDVYLLGRLRSADRDPLEIEN